MAYIIKIPDERGIRLRQLAVFQRKSIADTIGDLVNAELRRLGLAESIPGFQVEPVGTGEPGVRFQIESPAGTFGFPMLKPEDARIIADKLEVLATSAKPVRSTSIAPGTPLEMHIARVGISVAFGSARTKAQSRKVAFGVGLDVARLLCIAADAAEQLTRTGEDHL